MYKRFALLGLAGLALVGVVGVAVHEHGSSSRDGAAVTWRGAQKAFAARGIALVREPNIELPLGSKEHFRGALMNDGATARQGVVTILLVASEAEARAVAARHMAASDRGPCGGTVATDYHTWQARNVIASLSTCNYLAGAQATYASSPATASINRAMHDLAGQPGETRVG
jgi:hypothetical protein